MLVWYDQLVYVPVLIAPVRQEASDGDRDLAGPQLLQSNLVRVRVGVRAGVGVRVRARSSFLSPCTRPATPPQPSPLQPTPCHATLRPWAACHATLRRPSTLPCHATRHATLVRMSHGCSGLQRVGARPRARPHLLWLCLLWLYLRAWAIAGRHWAVRAGKGARWRGLHARHPSSHACSGSVSPSS